MNMTLKIRELLEEITKNLRETREQQQNLKKLEIFYRKFKYTDSSFFLSGWNIHTLKNIIDLQLSIIKWQNKQIQILQQSVAKLQIQ